MRTSPEDQLIAQRTEHLNNLKDLLIKSLEKRKSEISKTNVDFGISGFQQVVKDPIPTGSIICLNGCTGSGMTIFALKFLYHGIINCHENGIYISFDESKGSILSTAKVFGMDFAKAENEKKFMFIEYPYNELSQFDDKDSVIKDFIYTINARRLVIDPITPLSLQFDNELQRRKRLKDLFERLKQWGCTTLLLTDGIPEKEAIHSYIVKLSDGFFQFHFKRHGDSRIRLFEVPKMRGVEHSYNLFTFDINKKHAFEILKKKISTKKR